MSETSYAANDFIVNCIEQPNISFLIKQLCCTFLIINF